MRQMTAPKTDSESNASYPHVMRVQRFLARAGVASRRGSEALMTAGRVTVNGEVARELGTKVDIDRDIVEVDGKRVALATRPVYLMLNKPKGYLTTMSDPQGRSCVAELIPITEHPGLFPVGRLDYDTTGLLLFTTDGDLGQALLHPSHHVEKTYIALVDGVVRDRELEPLRKGIVLDDGPCQPAPCSLLRDDDDRNPFGARSRQTTLVIITLREGRKNQVKRMLGRIGHPVLELHRPQFGPLQLFGVAPGAWRYLDDNEVTVLRSAAGLDSRQAFL